MKRSVLTILLSVFAQAMSACGTGATPTLSTEPLIVEDQASFLAALRAEGATAEVVDSISQDFFSVEGQIITVNGAEVQVFEYESAEGMENAASQVAPDGGSIGTSMLTWIETPHFYKTGRIIVIYIGSDEKILNLLQTIMGPQFAGR
jgi:hypothetical protein